MSWVAVLPVMTTLLGQVPGADAPAQPAVVPLELGAPTPPQPSAPPALSFALSASPPGGEAAPETRWYGGPAVTIDAATILGFAALFEYDSRDTNKVALFGLLGLYLGGGPLIHGLHEHGRRAVGSFGLRAGALLAGLVVLGATWSSDTCGFWVDSGRTRPGACWIGATAPIYLPIAAMVIDDVFLAREEVSPAPAMVAGWTPRLQVTSGLALVGVGRTF